MIPALTLLCSLCTTPSDVPQWEARLGSTSFKERERASRLLGKTKNLHLCCCLVRSKDPEVARRAKLVRALFRSQILDSLDPYPCLDALLYDVNTRRYTWWDNTGHYHFLNHYGLDPYCNGGDPRWTPYRRATRRWVSDLLDHEVPLWVIQAILKEMHRKDNLAGFGWKEPVK